MGVSLRPSFLQLKTYKFINYRFVLEDLIKTSNKKSYLILDAGCGKGFSISYTPDKAELVGIDILRSNVAACRERWRKRNYVITDLTMLPFRDDAFDGAVSADVLEHVDDKTTAIKELARVTRKGGFFAGCSSNLLNPILWLDAKLPRLMAPLVMKLAEQGHYDRHSRFSPSSLARTLNSNGYRIICLSLLGYPQFSLKRSSSQALVFPWILFDRLSKKKILRYFKEILVWRAARV